MAVPPRGAADTRRASRPWPQRGGGLLRASHPPPPSLRLRACMTQTPDWSDPAALSTTTQRVRASSIGTLPPRGDSRWTDDGWMDVVCVDG